MPETNELPREVSLTYTQEEAMVEARVSFMRFCPMFCYYYYDQMVEHFTDEIDTLGTDGRRIFINPGYFLELKPMERCFALAHEVYHVIYKHPQRASAYRKAGTVEGLPFDHHLMNMAMDFVINADLINNQIGTCNPSWLYNPVYKGHEAVEDVYKDIYQPPPPGRPRPQGPQQPGGGNGQGQTQGGGQGGQQPSTTGSQPGDLPTYGKGGRPDRRAASNQGRFDEVMEPYQDPATGKEDLPSEMEFKEAVARAASAAKAIGKLPGSFQRVVDEILEPQVQWRDHLRMTIAGRLGRSRETWTTPNRRRIVLNPMIYLPGKRGRGADDVTVVVDNSGSISERELSAFFTETAAIIADCRPRLVRVIWCDASVRRVEEARSLDELAHIRVQGAPGGGGTDFRPPFEWLAERNIRPDTLVYLTDMYGTFPKEDPRYPVVWCATADAVKAPFGHTVHVKV